MTGLELLKAPEATAGEIADIISAPCPPTHPRPLRRRELPGMLADVADRRADSKRKSRPTSGRLRMMLPPTTILQ